MSKVSAESKAAARYKFAVSFVERIAIRSIIVGPAGPCPSCRLGPLEVKDPRRIAQYCALWDALRLDEIEEIATSATRVVRLDEISRAALSEDAAIPTESELASVAPATLDLDVAGLRFLYEIVAHRAGLNHVGPIVLRNLWTSILAAASERNVRLAAKTSEDQYQDDPTEDDSDMREISLSSPDRIVILRAMSSPQQCQHVFDAPRGQVFHGAPIDGPQGHAQLAAFVGAFERLGLGVWYYMTAVEQANATDDKVPSTDTLSFAEVKYLFDLLVRRCGNVPNGVRKLGGVIAQLDAIKGGAGKPNPPATEPVSETPATDVAE